MVSWIPDLNQCTPDTDDTQHDPCRPLRQVFDENECHESGDKDEISLLQR